MEMQLGYRGATRQTWKGDPLRTAVLQLRKDHPHASPDDINKYLAELAREDDDLLVALAEYGGTNTQIAIEAQERRLAMRPTPQARQERQIDEHKMIASIQSQIMLLNLEMPNGKRMRYCTGAEMEQFGQAYRRIARKVGKTKRVGQVLDEKGVKALMGGG